MAIPCGVCDEPVHEHTVICPHCGKPTGVAPDRTLSTAEVGAILATDPDADPAPPATLSAFTNVDALSEAALIAGVVVGAAVVGAAVGAVVETLRETRDKPALPTATAHIRRRHITPIPSTEPEQVEPPA